MTPMRIGVVGAGILGLAVARRLREVHPDAELSIFEKETAPAMHQTGHNSGVVHAGVYYSPGSLKATLCRRGVPLLREFCARNRIPYDECGKLIVARNELEVARLGEIETRARANGVPGLRRLPGETLNEIEPHVRGAEGLHSPSTAIVDFRAISHALLAELVDSGVQIKLGVAVTGFEHRRRETRVLTADGDADALDYVVVCAGLQSDRLAQRAGAGRDPVIVPFRGEYVRLVPARTHLVQGLIYPVPDPSFPFLGVHFTRRVDGNVDIGPNAVLALAREGYRRRDVSPPDVLETVRAPGFRRLVRRHWRMGAREMWGSMSRRAFVAQARSFVPDLHLEDVAAAPAGVRAQAVDPDGSLVDDFRIAGRDRVFIVRNAPSPAATSSLAIAEYLVARMPFSAARSSDSKVEHRAI